MNNILLTSIVGLVAGMIGATLVTSNLEPADPFKVIDRERRAPDEQVAPSSEIAYEDAVVSAVDSSLPAVVSIVISQDVPVIERYFEEFGSPFNSFFNDPFSLRVPRLRQNGTERQQVGGGSGFIVSRDGMIITNRHVVDQDNAEYTVFLSDGTSQEAEVVAKDPLNDLAILKIEGTDFPFVEFGDSDQLIPGQSVIAIGNALSEFSNSVSVGVISGLSRSIVAGNTRGQAETLDDIIQTDAAINPGNSGGPLLNLSGQVIGVNVAVAVGSENIGFAIPSNAVRTVLTSIEDHGEIVRPYLGVRFIPVTPELEQLNNLSVNYGALIVAGDTQAPGILPDSPASRAGLRAGDIILEVNKTKITSETSLNRLIQRYQVGDTLTLLVLSGGEQREVSITLEQIFN